jgi:hypothetical protein
LLSSVVSHHANHSSHGIAALFASCVGSGDGSAAGTGAAESDVSVRVEIPLAGVAGGPTGESTLRSRIGTNVTYSIGCLLLVERDEE